MSTTTVQKHKVLTSVVEKLVSLSTASIEIRRSATLERTTVWWFWFELGREALERQARVTPVAASRADQVGRVSRGSGGECTCEYAPAQVAGSVASLGETKSGRRDGSHWRQRFTIYDTDVELKESPFRPPQVRPSPLCPWKWACSMPQEMYCP